MILLKLPSRNQPHKPCNVLNIIIEKLKSKLETNKTLVFVVYIKLIEICSITRYIMIIYFFVASLVVFHDYWLR